MFNSEIDILGQRIGLNLDDKTIDEIHSLDNTKLMILRKAVEQDITDRVNQILKGVNNG